MARRKNTKRIDPRYFLSETTHRDLDEGVMSKLAIGAALIGSMLGISPKAEASIQMSQDTIEAAGNIPIADAAGKMNTAAAAFTYGLISSMDKPEAQEAAELFKKAWQSEQPEYFDDLPQWTHVGLEMGVAMMKGAINGQDLDPEVRAEYQSKIKNYMELGKKAGIK